jgi:phosphoribosylformylglycinamidine cyclo-ligase
MCVNDIVVMGAEPLYFLDYYASGRLDLTSGKAILEGIAEGCRQAGAALLGGETAEMPGVYPEGGYDLAGFAVGIADRPKIVDGKKLEPGHAIYGIASTGIHSNGFSLVRKILIEDAGIRPHDPVPFEPSKSWADLLLAPTRIYVSLVLDLLREFSITGLVHVTGGGITENVPRILPANMSARINPRAWPRPALFSDLQERGSVTSREMFRVFNMGIGLVIMVPPGEKELFEKFLSDRGESWYLLGEIIPGGGEVVYDRSF